MGSAGRSFLFRRRAKAHTFSGVGASEGFAAARVVWICVLWTLVHSVLASKQVKNLARQVAGPRYRGRPLPLGLQRPVGGAASLGGTAVRATARPGTLPRKLPLVLAISNEPGRFFGRVAFGRAGHGYITFRWNNAALGLPQRKGHSPRTRGSRTSGRLRRRGGERGGVPPHPPSRQPRCFGVLFVHASHDG
jgi:hypothetical protein